MTDDRMDHSKRDDHTWAHGYRPDPWAPEAYVWREQVEADLLAANWIVAKTMPENPHEYTLRREWKDRRRFVSAVEFIRRHGYVHWFWRRPYLQLGIEEHVYWTMGWPPEETELINRKREVE